jgi:type IV secretory pathway TraG/TraD family ATPase VirD4
VSLSATIAKIQEAWPGILLRLAMVGNWLSKKFNKEHPLFHSSFATLSELKNLLCRQMDGAYLLLGIGEYGHILRVKSTDERKELGNVMVIGRTRCGKGLFAISQILSWTESLIVNDIKGELRAQTAGSRATDGRRVFTFDPTGYGDRYDPFLGKVTEDDLRDAATKLLSRANDGENAIFTMRAVTMLTQLFLGARLEEKPLLPYVQSAVYAGPVDTAKRLHAISLQHNRYPNLATRFLDMSLRVHA